MKLWKKDKSLYLLPILAILCFVAIYETGILTNMDVSGLSHWFRQQGMIGMLVYIIAYTIRPVFFIPMLPVTLFGGYTFGALTGAILNIIGAGNSAVLAFFITRKMKGKSIKSFLQRHKVKIFDNEIEKNGFRVVLYIRLIPFIPFDSINYGMGLSKVKIRDYIWSTYIGIIPGIFVTNFIPY